MSPSSLDQLERYYAKNRQEWHQWLSENHETSPGVWLIYHKKNSEQNSVEYEEAVEEALCFGWIDSKVNALDEKRYMQVFTPRKPGSTWSKINKDRVTKLIKMGLMHTAGLKKIKKAKKDGSWNILDDVEDLIIPEDLQEVLNGNKTALENFNSFTDSSKKQILWWVISAKRPETRKNRIKRIVILAEKNQRP
jgi:uncharacterized protein YdeI (YjbR/CyaY-like superfamily)